MISTIDTASFARTMREKIIRPASCEILVAKLEGSDQEHDLTVPPNCEGLGRVRHFRRATSVGWPGNPLPIDPASKALGLPNSDQITAQVFQNAACAWRCWYCYVPYDLLAGDASRGRWVTSDALIDMYNALPDKPSIIDLSGGSPDLTPEWIPWMMVALRNAGLSEKTFLWSDDNLSTDYVFTVLSENDRIVLSEYRNYARVCCLKGFDKESFTFNTTAAGEGFDRQFAILSGYFNLGLALYGYVTLTGTDRGAVHVGIPRLLDRLQQLHENLPLRVVPLEIVSFTPTDSRSKSAVSRRSLAERVQNEAIEVWSKELQRRYSAAQRATNIADVPLS